MTIQVGSARSIIRLVSCSLWVGLSACGLPLKAVELHRQIEALQLYADSGSEPTVIDGRDIACRTARNWVPAQVLRARARTVVQVYCDEDENSRKAANSLAIFLNMQANHQQDIGAASALRAYYTRIALQEQLRLSEESLRLVDQAEAKHAAIQDGGLPAGTDLSDFERQRLEIKDRQLQLRSQDRQLRSLLAQLAQADYAMDEVRQERLEVFENLLDCECLKQFALSSRYDLRGWVYLASQVNDTSAPVFSQMFSTVIGGFALPMPTVAGIKNLLCPPDYSCLAANMQREIDLTVETHRRWICQALEEKCANLQLTYQRIDLAQQTIESWESRIGQLERLQKMGQTDPEQGALARIGWMKSRSEEISRRMEARMAEIDLAEATGNLACRCCEGQPWLVTGCQ